MSSKKHIYLDLDNHLNLVPLHADAVKNASSHNFFQKFSWNEILNLQLSIKQEPLIYGQINTIIISLVI